MRTHILLVILVIIFVVPATAVGASFVSSLLQGKSPSEAISILGEQLDSLFGRVSTLETEQVSTDLELERLRVENENLRLKTEQLSAQTEQIRAKEDRMSRCVELGSQIQAREREVKDLYEQLLQPLREEERQLKVQLNESSSMDEAIEIKKQRDNKRVEIEVVFSEMSKTLDALRETPEMKALLNELNNVLLCA